MSRKPRSSLSRPVPREPVAEAIARPLEIFEAALDLLGRFEHPAPGAGGMPAAALPSLLARCESVVEREGPAGPCLLICVDGLEPLSPGWWAQHAGGLGVQAIPPAEDAAMLEAQLAVFERSERRQGRAALTLAGLDVPTALVRAFGSVRLLTWHPWSSFMAAPRGVTLDAHCQDLGRALDRLDGVATLPIEAGGVAPASQAAAIAAAFGWTLPSRPGASGRGPARMQPPDSIEGGPVYRQLCERLGYAPDTVPVPPRADPGPDHGTGRGTRTLEALERRYAEAEAEPADPPAQVSWFLPRLAALGLPAPITDDDGLKDLVAVLDGCCGTLSFREKLDPLVEGMTPSLGALTLLLAAAHWARAGEAMIAMGLASEAMDLAPARMPTLHQLAASLYVDLGHPKHALHLAAGPLLEPGYLAETSRKALLAQLYGESLKPDGEHGQDLLITYLQANPPRPIDGRKRRLVEIGTTREAVPGQGSTKQLAEQCSSMGLDFTTVDMDPENGRRARQMFRRKGYPFTAVSQKGEEYLAQTGEPLDYVFLDAYDFDHGKHSEWRQSRYTQFLGDRISDAACHQMHLECAQALVEKLAPDGLICFDDTWLDEIGEWTAKGKTAMPYLLEHGFEVIEARNRAALLRRKSAG